MGSKVGGKKKKRVLAGQLDWLLLGHVIIQSVKRNNSISLSSEKLEKVVGSTKN